MTLAIAIRAHDGILLAADSRISTREGESIIGYGDDELKIQPWGPHGLAFSGFVGWTDEVLEYIRHDPSLANPPHDITVAHDLLRRSMHEKYGDRIFGTPPFAILVAGHDDRGRAATYSIHSSAGFQPSRRAHPDAIGSISGCGLMRVLQTLVFGAVRPSLEKARVFSVMLIRLVAESDFSVGGPVRLASVVPGEFRYEGEVSPMLEANAAELRAHIQSALRSVIE